MREITQRFNFSAGLRPYQQNVRNKELLTQCLNLHIDNERLIPSVTFSYPVPSAQGESAGYPFPQLYLGQRYNFLLCETEIYQIDDDWNLISLWGGLTANKTWHVADFAEFLIFTNGLFTVCYPELDETVAEITCFQYW